MSRKNQGLARQEEVALHRQICLGEPGAHAAKCKMVEANLGLVHYVLNRFYRGSAQDEDAYQAGCIGLWKATEKFDPKKGRFSTIACWYIRAEIGRHLDYDTGVIRLPAHISNAVWAARRGKEVWQKLELVEAAERALQVESLDEPIPFIEDGANIGDTIPDPDAVVDYDDTSDQIDEALGLLPPLAKEILELRFGLNGNGGVCMSLSELAEKVGTDPKKVQTIEAKSLRLLREKAPQLRLLLTS